MRIFFDEGYIKIIDYQDFIAPITKITGLFNAQSKELFIFLSQHDEKLESDSKDLCRVYVYDTDNWNQKRSSDYDCGIVMPSQHLLMNYDNTRILFTDDYDVHNLKEINLVNGLKIPATLLNTYEIIKSYFYGSNGDAYAITGDNVLRSYKDGKMILSDKLELNPILTKEVVLFVATIFSLIMLICFIRRNSLIFAPNLLTSLFIIIVYSSLVIVISLLVTHYNYKMSNYMSDKNLFDEIYRMASIWMIPSSFLVFVIFSVFRNSCIKLPHKSWVIAFITFLILSIIWIMSWITHPLPIG